jgi:hypothetical protein
LSRLSSSRGVGGMRPVAASPLTSPRELPPLVIPEKSPAPYREPIGFGSSRLIQLDNPPHPPAPMDYEQQPPRFGTDVPAQSRLAPWMVIPPIGSDKSSRPQLASGVKKRQERQKKWNIFRWICITVSMLIAITALIMVCCPIPSFIPSYPIVGQ